MFVMTVITGYRFAAWWKLYRLQETVHFSTIKISPPMPEVTVWGSYGRALAWGKAARNELDSYQKELLEKAVLFEKVANRILLAALVAFLLFLLWAWPF